MPSTSTPSKTDSTWRDRLAAELDQLLVTAATSCQAKSFLETVLALLRPAAADSTDWRGWLRNQLAMVYNAAVALNLPEAAEYVRVSRLRELHRDESHAKKKKRRGQPQPTRCRIVGASGRPGAVVSLILPAEAEVTTIGETD